MEAADGLVVVPHCICSISKVFGSPVGVGHGALALKDVDFNLGLVRSSSSRAIAVGSRREDLALLGGDGGVPHCIGFDSAVFGSPCAAGVDQTGHHAAEGLDTEA